MSSSRKNQARSSKNFFATLSPESSDPQDLPDASTDGGVFLSPEQAPTQEPRAFTRAPPGGFGDRLSMARGIRPQDVPPAPPRAAPTAPTALAFDVDVGPSTRATSRYLTNNPSAYKPRYGSMPGSYTSPYDIGGKTPGDPRLPTNSITWQEFEAKHGSGRHLSHPSTTLHGLAATSHTATPGPSRRTISFGEMPPVDIKGKGKAPASAAAEQVTPSIPEGVSNSSCY